MVFDFDDAIFTTELQKLNWLAAWKQRRNAAGMPAMLGLARLAVVENEYTAEYAGRHCRAVAIITGPIDTRRYPGKGPAAAAGQVVLGWIGSATTLPYLDLIHQPLVRLSRRFPQMRVRVVGAEKLDLEGVPVDARSWSLEREVEDLRAFDIGLMPVPDDPWTRGKGGYKLLQYMAMELPVVTSPVGINQEIVRDGENGFWARDAGEWEERLARLIEDPQLRLEMGRRGRARAETDYALQVHSARLLALLRDLAGEPPQ